MILSGKDILSRVKKDNLIESFSEDGLGGAGYDMRIGNIYTLEKGGSLEVDGVKTPDVDEVDSLTYVLKPHQYILIESLEKVNMSNDLMARILPRSSIFRCGCSLITAVVDPGFHGTLTMGLKNVSDFDFEIEKNARIAQIVFEEVSEKTKSYDGKYQGGKVV